MLADQPAAEPLVREATRRAERLGKAVLASWTRPAPMQDGLSFFAQADTTADRALWLRPATGEALVGVGAAHVLTATGVNRFQNVSAAWQELIADAVIDDSSGVAQGGPVLIGGFRFDPLRAPSNAWNAFTNGTDARLVLPERLLAVRHGAAWLTTNVVAKPAQWPADASQNRGLDTESGSTSDEPPLSSNAWKALTGSVARGIRHGQLGLQKVVLARALETYHRRPIDTLAALRQLAQAYPSTTVFAFAHGQACFLGATPERSELLLELSPHVRIRLGNEDGRALLAVEDEGPGIPEEHMGRVFERFYRVDGTRASGSGLGLAIAGELARLMDGSIELESRPGRTVVSLLLPAESV